MPEEDTPKSGAASNRTTRDPKVRRISNKTPGKPQEKPEPKEQALNRADTASETDGGALDSKRPNRRRRGKGKSQAKESARETEAIALSPDEPVASAPIAISERQEKTPQQRPPQTPQPPRRKLDAEKVAKKAWKIYLAEVSEEGVALIGDNDARELARRCFRLAEVFLEEEDRRN